LDAAAIERLMISLKQLKTAPAMLLITHDLNVATFADHLYEMKDGRLNVPAGLKDEAVRSEMSSESSIRFPNMEIDLTGSRAPEENGSAVT
jgi:ABC-type lipoprotein export system ATPase subunit